MGHSQPTYIIEHSTGFFQSKALVLPLGIKYLELANAPPWFGLLWVLTGIADTATLQP